MDEWNVVQIVEILDVAGRRGAPDGRRRDGSCSDAPIRPKQDGA
jgi:hypothetical protein